MLCELWQEKDGGRNVSGGHVLDFYFELSSSDDPSYKFLRTIPDIMT